LEAPHHGEEGHPGQARSSDENNRRGKAGASAVGEDCSGTASRAATTTEWRPRAASGLQQMSIFAPWLRAVPPPFLSPARMAILQQGDEVSASRPRGCFCLAAVSAQGVMASKTGAVQGLLRPRGVVSPNYVGLWRAQCRDNT